MSIKKYLMAITVLVASLNAPLLPLVLEREIPMRFAMPYSKKLCHVRFDNENAFPNLVQLGVSNLVCKENWIERGVARFLLQSVEEMHGFPIAKIEEIFNDEAYIGSVDIIVDIPSYNALKIVLPKSVKISFTKDNLEKLFNVAKDIVPVAIEDRYGFLAQCLAVNFGFDSSIDAAWQSELFVSGTEVNISLAALASTHLDTSN